MGNLEVDVAIHAITVATSTQGHIHLRAVGITLVIHFPHKHSKQHQEWKELVKSLTSTKLILCVDRNSLTVKHKDALMPPELEHDSALGTRENRK